MSKTDGIGTWVWNDTIDIPGMYYSTTGDMGSQVTAYAVDLVCNNVNYTHIGLLNSAHPMFEIENAVAIYENGLWHTFSGISNYGQTIDIKTAPSAEFLTILQANATYQESTTQFLDETGLRQFVTKTKEYIDSLTTYQITEVTENADSIDFTIVTETVGGGGNS